MTRDEARDIVRRNLGKEFTSSVSGDTFKVSGWHERRIGYPIIAKRVVDGAEFKMTIHAAEDIEEGTLRNPALEFGGIL